MGLLKDHLKMSAALEKAVDDYNDPEHWPIVVDAGFYTVYHMMEAAHALDCRDTSTFADGFDLLERILVPQGLPRNFVRQFDYLFFFRRGAIYGPHVPTEAQMRQYVAVAKDALKTARAFYENASAAGRSV